MRRAGTPSPCGDESPRCSRPTTIPTASSIRPKTSTRPQTIRSVKTTTRRSSVMALIRDDTPAATLAFDLPDVPTPQRPPPGPSLKDLARGSALQAAPEDR